MLYLTKDNHDDKNRIIEVNEIIVSHLEKDKQHILILNGSTFFISCDKYNNSNHNANYECEILQAFLNDKPVSGHNCKVVFARKTYYKMLANYMGIEKAKEFLEYEGHIKIIFRVFNDRRYILKSYEFLDRGENRLFGKTE
jgi:hypothetical protein